MTPPVNTDKNYNRDEQVLCSHKIKFVVLYTWGAPTNNVSEIQSRKIENIFTVNEYENVDMARYYNGVTLS